MATMQGITGKLSGKMGSAVFRVREGQQIVTQYNPKIKNPNTQGQQEQRAKFKLMTQLAAIMAPAIGSMSPTKRPARQGRNPRNGFVQRNFPLVEVTSDDAEVTAKIPMEQVKLTSSFRNFPALDVNSTTNGITVDLVSELPSEVAIARIITVGYNDNVPTIVDIRDVPASSFDNPVTILTGDGKFTVLAYGLIPSESAKTSIDLDNIHTPEDEDFISAVELNALVANGSILETMTVGANVTVVA